MGDQSGHVAIYIGGACVAELSNEVFDRIQTLCKQGDAYLEAGNYRASLEQYWSAWDLLPEPQTTWETATWILAAIGEANFLCGDYSAGRDNLSMAMQCPDAIGNPFLHLRLGQCQFELGYLDRAADELTRAYMGAGSEIFEREGNKYFEFLKTRLQPPIGGW